MSDDGRDKDRASRLKDRVLNARIPEDLDRELRAQAERLDMPVSQLVRGILQRTVDLVGNFSGNIEHLVTEVVEDVASFRHVAESAPACMTTPFDKVAEDVLGWQEIRLHRDARCAISGVRLRAGDKACWGMRPGRKGGVVASPEALEAYFAQSREREQWMWARLHRPATCDETGVELRAGDHAWLQPEAIPPLTLSEEGYQRRFSASAGAHAPTDAHTASSTPQNDRS